MILSGSVKCLGKAALVLLLTGVVFGSANALEMERGPIFLHKKISLSVQDQSFDTILKQLSLQTNRKIERHQSVLFDKNFNFVVKEKSLHEILDTISQISNTRWYQVGDTITFSQD